MNIEVTQVLDIHQPSVLDQPGPNLPAEKSTSKAWMLQNVSRYRDGLQEFQPPSIRRPRRNVRTRQPNKRRTPRDQREGTQLAQLFTGIPASHSDEGSYLAKHQDLAVPERVWTQDLGSCKSIFACCTRRKTRSDESQKDRRRPGDLEETWRRPGGIDQHPTLQVTVCHC